MITFEKDMRMFLFLTEKSLFNLWEYRLIGKPTKVEQISHSYNKNESICVDFIMNPPLRYQTNFEKYYFLLVGKSPSHYCIVLFRGRSYIINNNTIGIDTCEISGKVIDAIEGDGDMPVIPNIMPGYEFNMFDPERVTRTFTTTELKRANPALDTNNLFMLKYKVMGCISRIIFNPPATVIYWMDGTKTTCKAMEGDTFSKEIGVAMCIAKKFFGNSRSEFKHFVYDLAEDYSKQAEAIVARKAKKKQAQEESNAQVDSQ